MFEVFFYFYLFFDLRALTNDNSVIGVTHSHQVFITCKALSLLNEFLKICLEPRLGNYKVSNVFRPFNCSIDYVCCWCFHSLSYVSQQRWQLKRTNTNTWSDLYQKKKKVQTKISSFLKPTTEKEYNYSMDVVYVEGNHFDIDILFFFVNETHTSITRPLTS